MQSVRIDSRLCFWQGICSFDKSEFHKILSIYLRSEIVLVNDDITTTIELHVYSYYIVDLIMLLIPLSFCSISFPSKWKVHSISFPVIVIPILKAGTNCLWHYRKKVTKRIITESDILDKLMRGIIQNQSMSFHKVIQRNKKRH